jgi:hypothetical protein
MIEILRFNKTNTGNILNYNLEGVINNPKAIDVPWLLQTSTSNYVSLAAVHQYQQVIYPDSKKKNLINKLLPGLMTIAGIHAYEYGANKVNVHNHYYARYISDDLFTQRVFSFVNSVNYNNTIVYRDIGAKFFQCGEIYYYTRSINKIYDSCGILAIHEFDILCALVIPSELVKYQKLFYLLNGYYDPKGLILLVKNEFDNTSYQHQGLRGAYKKDIKTPIINTGIPIVTVDDIYEVISFNPLKTIDAQTIDGVNNWITDIATEVMQKEKELYAVKFS